MVFLRVQFYDGHQDTVPHTFVKDYEEMNEFFVNSEVQVFWSPIEKDTPQSVQALQGRVLFMDHLKRTTAKGCMKGWYSAQILLVKDTIEEIDAVKESPRKLVLPVKPSHKAPPKKSISKEKTKELAHATAIKSVFAVSEKVIPSSEEQTKVTNNEAKETVENAAQPNKRKRIKSCDEPYNDNEGFEKKLKEQETKHEQKIDKMEKKYEGKLKAMKGEYEKKLNNLRKELCNAMDRVNKVEIELARISELNICLQEQLFLPNKNKALRTLPQAKQNRDLSTQKLAAAKKAGCKRPLLGAFGEGNTTYSPCSSNSIQQEPLGDSPDNLKISTDLADCIPEIDGIEELSLSKVDEETLKIIEHYAVNIDSEGHVLELIEVDQPVDNTAMQSSLVEITEESLLKLMRKAKIGKPGDSVFIRDLAGMLWQREDLAKRSATGTACPSKPGKPAFQECTPYKKQIIHDMMVMRLDKEGITEETERKKRLASIREHLSGKIKSVRA